MTMYLAATTTTPTTTTREGSESEEPGEVASTVLWDRKVEGGFPETKELKRRVRDVIEPGRDLGHVDRDYRKTPRQEQQQTQDKPATARQDKTVGTASKDCEECAPE